MLNIPRTRMPILLGALLIGTALSVGANRAVASDTEPAVDLAVLDGDHSAPIVLAKHRYRYYGGYGHHSYGRHYYPRRSFGFSLNFGRSYSPYYHGYGGYSPYYYGGSSRYYGYSPYYSRGYYGSGYYGSGYHGGGYYGYSPYCW